MSFADFAFGKCLPQYGLEPEELFREPLEENQVAVLRTMLEELQGVGLGWQDPFVQCRMQGALFALRTKSDLPKNLCASLAPPPLTLPSNSIDSSIDSNDIPSGTEAFVRYAPPLSSVGQASNTYANELFYGPPPPLRKRNRFQTEDIPILNPYVEKELQDELLETGNLDSVFDQAEQQKELENEMLLRTILSEEFPNDKYPVQELPKDHGYQNDNEFVPNFPDVLKRKNYPNYQPDNQPSHFKERQHLLEEEEVDELLDEIADQQQHASPFREVAQHRNQKPHLAHESQQHQYRFDEAESDQNDLPLFPFKPSFEYGVQNDRPETGIYTEGGVVYPESDQSTRFDSKEEARNVLADILGFTRHERLDVKKPGPVVVPPSSAPEEVVKGGEVAGSKNKTQEETGPKMKKVPNNDHSGNDDHAPHVVDTAYAHVRVRNA